MADLGKIMGTGAAPGAVAQAALAASVERINPSALAQATYLAGMTSDRPSVAAMLADQVSKSYAASTAAVAAQMSADFTKRLGPSLGLLEATGVAKLGKMLADSAVGGSAIRSLDTGAVSAMLKSIEEDFVRPTNLLGDLNSFIAASDRIKTNLGLPTSWTKAFTRPTALPLRTPVQHRREVRRFLGRLHPRLLRKLDGIYEARDLSDGVSQAACSAAELLKLMTFSLVKRVDVQDYARRTYRSKATKRHAMELISIVYALDGTALMLLSDGNELGSHFHDLKHDDWDMDDTDARVQFDRLIEQLEDLLLFLALAIER